MIRWIPFLVLGLICLGCSSGGASVAEPTPSKVLKKASPPTDPDRALYEQIRSGIYQINAAMDAIEETRKTAKKMAGRELGETQSTLNAIAKILDTVGENLSEFASDPPEFDKFKADFAAQDERRLKAITVANESLGDLYDAQDLVEKLLSSKPPEPEKTQLEDADATMDDCISGVEEAVKAMGGKVATS